MLLVRTSDKRVMSTSYLQTCYQVDYQREAYLGGCFTQGPGLVPVSLLRLPSLRSHMTVLNYKPSQQNTMLNM